jgi:hypothetical protein
MTGQLMENKLTKILAVMDSVIISIRQQQIELAKLIAKEVSIEEERFLEIYKSTSLELLKKNGLEY